MRIIAAASGLVLAAAAQSAWASCVTVEPVMTPQVLLDPLDAAGAAEFTQPFALVFRRADTGSGAVTVRYQIVDEDSSIIARVGVTGGPAVVWQSQDSTRQIGAFRSDSSPLLRSGVVVLDDDDPMAQATVFMRLVNLREDLAAGVYREQFTVRYWCGDDQMSMPYEAPGAIAVSVAVPNVLSASVAGVSPRGEIDFMDFAVSRRQVMISVRSTGSYEVSARSLNSGVMVREGTGAGVDDADRIRYQARLEGTPLVIDGTTTRSMPRAGLGGSQFALEVEAEDTRSKRAGAYADTILLTLAPVN